MIKKSLKHTIIFATICACTIFGIKCFADETKSIVPQIIKCGNNTNDPDVHRCYAGARLNNIFYIEPSGTVFPYFLIDGTYKAYYTTSLGKVKDPQIFAPSRVQVEYQNILYPQIAFMAYSDLGWYADMSSTSWQETQPHTSEAACHNLDVTECPIIYRPSNVKYNGTTLLNQ